MVSSMTRWVFFVGLALSSTYAHADRIQELEQRIAELENLSLDLEEKVGSKGLVTALDSLNIGLGGYFFAEASRVKLDNGSAATGVPTSLAYLVLDADMGEQWEFELGQVFGYVSTTLDELNPGFGDPRIAQSNPLSFRSPLRSFAGSELEDLSSVRSTFTVDVNIKYKHSNKLTLTMGQMRSPIGIINRQFYPLNIHSPHLPLFLKNVTGTGNMYGEFFKGIKASGKFFPNDSSIISYNLFTGTPTNPAIPGNPLERTSQPQSGARISYSSQTQDIELGLNAVSGQRTRAGNFAGNNFTLGGVDFFLDKGPVQIKAEFYQSDEDNNHHRTAYYFQPAWHINSAVDVFVRHDVMHITPYSTTTNIYPALGKAVENTVGVFITPTHNTRIRAGYSKLNYEDQNDYEVETFYLGVVASF